MTYLEKKQAWLDSDLVEEKDKEIIRNCDDETLLEMFSSDLAFGTAGMRALLGPGSARLNNLTVRKATIGVANFLLRKYGAEAARNRGFAISFDNRHYSKEFRDTASKVLTEMGFNVYTFRDPHPTPELSYTVRHLNCVGGLMLTASHNPKEYNGYKFYDEKGCQGVYRIIDGVIASIKALPDELSCTYEKVPEDKIGKVRFLDDDENYDLEFVNKEVATSLYLEAYGATRLTRIIFSPECGCDCKVGPLALRKAGYEVATVPGQDYFDPDFTHTENPNPETDGAYKGAYETLKKLNASSDKKFHIIIVTDPDADRCGLAFVNSKGELQRFNGNQTGALLIDFLLGTLQRRNALPNRGVICNTFVTGSQGAEIAKSYGVGVRTTATGFKYIGNMADRLEMVGEKYLFGYEESYGYLLADFVRDKDSLQSIVAIADMTEYYLRQGKTLDVAYEELSKRTGRFFNEQISVEFKGANALERMSNEIDKLRNDPPQVIDGEQVETIYDYLKRLITDFTRGYKASLNDPDIDYSDCLRFNFKNGGFIAIRPSGTEPKVKFYVETVGLPDEEAKKAGERKVAELKKRMGLEQSLIKFRISILLLV